MRFVKVICYRYKSLFVFLNRLFRFLFRKLCIHTMQKLRNKRLIFKSIKYVHQCL